MLLVELATNRIGISPIEIKTTPNSQFEMQSLQRPSGRKAKVHQK